jgi:MarR-like DNA-binding transcriptional regulator SgrR of sgrS sRNA
MRTSSVKQARALLRDHPDGLTLKQINSVLHRSDPNMRRVLREMPDTYIDRWEMRARKTPAAVWCIVVPPEDCPRPRK